MELNKIKSWKEENNSVVLQFDKGQAEITFSEDDILRFRYAKDNVFSDEEMYILDGRPNQKKFKLDYSLNQLLMTTEKLNVEIYLQPFRIIVLDKLGNKIISTASNFLTSNNQNKITRFKLTEEEKIYGLGQDPMANLNQRDKERRMWHQWGSNSRSGNGGIPFMMSTRGYGILLNSSWSARFAIGRAEVAEFNRMGDIMAPAPWGWTENSGETGPDTSAILLDGGEMDLFIICRNKFDDIINDYCKLTGFAPMLPKWAYGFIQCKNRYRSQEELLKVARTMREKKIPCDALVIDWLWFREFGDLNWDKRYWPDAEGMFKELESLGFKVMQAQHPFLAEGGLKYKEFEEAGYMNKVPEGKRFTFDHSNPEARKAWWREFKRLYLQGIRGYWTDMGELEEHFPGTKSYLGCREKVHNIYSLLWAKGLYDGQRNDFGERVFTLARTTYAGMQKHGTVLWSGDIDASWEVLKSQVVVGQGVCLSGMPYWTTDIGGFITNMDFTPELYIRWLQWGVFCPIFRTHGTRPANEPWSFGNQAEAIIKEYIELRYKLLPYIYSCANKITEEGKPLMRAMIMDYEDDEKASENVYQFMFGPSILVAPVLDKGAREKEVYLPEGSWYDYWTETRYEGKTTIKVSVPLNKIPLFVKSGNIIPMAQVVEYIDEKLQKDIIVHIYPGQSASFELYDDDGHSYDYEKGKYIKTMFQYEEADVKSIKIYPVHADETLLERRSYTVVLHDTENPQEVLAGDNVHKQWSYCEQNRILTLYLSDLQVNSNADITIKASALSESNEKIDITESAKLHADTDMDSSGRVTVRLSVDTPCRYEDIKLSARLIVPEGWTIRKSDRSAHDINSYWRLKTNNEDLQETRIYPGSSLSWQITPLAETLPLISQGIMVAEYLSDDGCIYKTSIPVTWGTGHITRWSLLGSFENWDNTGLDFKYEPELKPEEPYYIMNNKKLSWIRDVENEFNCFGYVDLRRLGSYSKGEVINGVSYCKCKIWSEEERNINLELSAESGIKVWINKQEVFKTSEIAINERITSVSIKRGWNELMVKVAVFCEKPYSGREYGFNIRMIGENEDIIKEFLYAI
jgi:alpha-glucosidase